MSETLPAPLLRDVSGFIDRRLGLHFPAARSGDLVRGLKVAAGDFGFVDVTGFARWLLATEPGHDQLEALSDALTVGETYFFRDRRLFEVIEEEILPDLLRQRTAGDRRLRVWSAGCCSGEEPYSLAIGIRRLLGEAKDWNVSLLGTDLNPRFLLKAARGVYGSWSFRDTAPELRSTWFVPVDTRHWQIAPGIRSMATFAPLNLVEDKYPSLATGTNALDLIFCRNVLIYFSPEQVAKVIENLSHCLVEGGWLVLGPSEIPPSLPDGMVRVTRGGLILCRKQSAAARPASRPSAILPPVPEPWTLPAAAGALHAQAEQLYQSGRYAESEEMLAAQPAAGADPRDEALLVRVLANQGRMADALACCERLIAADKTNAASHFLQASLLQEQGRAAEAGAAFRRALYLEPDFVLAHFALGNLARGEGRTLEAERHFRNALALARRLAADAPVPEADGLTAGRLAEIIVTLGVVREAESASLSR